MNQKQQTDERRKQAKKRVKELKDFYIHAMVYVIVNIGLFVILVFGS